MTCTGEIISIIGFVIYYCLATQLTIVSHMMYFAIAHLEKWFCIQLTIVSHDIDCCIATMTYLSYYDVIVIFSESYMSQGALARLTSWRYDKKSNLNT